MAVSTERDPVALRADLARVAGGADRRRRRSRSARSASRACRASRTRRCCSRPRGTATVHPLVIRVEPTGHTVFPATAFDTQVQVMQALARRGHGARCPRCCGSRRTRRSSALGSCACAASTGEVPADNPELPRRGLDAGALAERPAPRVGERHRHDGAHPPARPRRRRARLDRRRSTPAEQLELDHEYRTLRVRRRALPGGRPRLRASSRRRVPPATDRPALCWGDSRIGNMIFGADQRVAAVLDWEMVTAGDPVQDLAWYLAARPPPRRWPSSVPRLPGPPDARGVDRPVGGGQRALGRRTSSGTSCSAPPATRRSWSG